MVPAIITAEHARRFHRELALMREGSGRSGDRRWRWVKALLSLVVVTVFAVILVAGLREVDWQETGRALRRYDQLTVVTGIVLALCGYGVASSYELLGRRYARHQLPAVTTGLIGFVAYAFAMNLGALLGGWVVRFRLYTRRGLTPRRVARVIGIGVLTNWSGYLLLAGLVFSLQPPLPPPDWPIHADALRGLGLLLLGLCACYLWLCSRHEGRHWQLRGVRLHCPPLGFALRQIVASSLSWSLMAAVIANYLPDSVSYVTVVAVLFLSSIAGLIVRIPAGLGVMEAVFVAALAHRVGGPVVLAAMLAFRASYYLFPFLLALAVYLVLEAGSSREANRSSRAVAPRPAPEGNAPSPVVFANPRAFSGTRSAPAARHRSVPE